MSNLKKIRKRILPVNKVTPAKEPLILAIEDWATDLARRPPLPHLIKHILPAQKGEYIALAGRTGIGKTNLALHLGFCLATGTPFFGLECRKVKVAYLAFEGDARNLMDRYNKLKLNFPPTERRLRFDMVSISNPKRMLKDVVYKAEGCRVMIIDPVKYMVAGNYLKPDDAAQFIRLFKEQLALHRMASIITLPIRKPNAKSLIQPGDVYSMKGATEYADSATSILLIERKSHSRSDNETILHFAKHRIATKELKPLDLHFNQEKCTFEKEEGVEIHETETEGEWDVRLRIPK